MPNYAMATQAAGFVSNEVHHQRFRTCYAYAVATGLREAMEMRQFSKIPKHSALREDIVRIFKYDGGMPHLVLNRYCNKKTKLFVRKENKYVTYRTDKIKYDQINLEMAMRCANRRAIIAGFYVSDNQWAALINFCSMNSSDVFVPPQPTGRAKNGHAVVITGIGKANGHRYFKIKNSWGSSSGDGGYFRVYCKTFPFDGYFLILY